MKTLKQQFILSWLMLWPVCASGLGEDPVNYLKLTQTIAVTQLRAGNHDSEGQNEYYFRVEMHGLLFSKEESKKNLVDRRKITVKMGDLGDFKIKSLDFWDSASDPIEGVSILGDQIRSLVSQVMTDFKILEGQVSVLVEIQMYERNQRFGLIGEDVKIGRTLYFAIPESLPRRPNLKDLKLEIVDEKGVLVGIAVSYEFNRKLVGKK